MIARWSPTAMAAAVSYVAGLSPHAPPSLLYAGLSSTPFGPSGTGRVELAVSGYHRQLIALTLTSGADAAQAATTGAVTFATLGLGAYRGIGLFDALVAGTLWFWADLDVQVDIEAGDSVTFAAGLLRIGLNL